MLDIIDEERIISSVDPTKVYLSSTEYPAGTLESFTVYPSCCFMEMTTDPFLSVDP